MLFIGDIHIHPRYGDLTIDTIRNYINNHDDDHIVFLGDFVYHFSNHRPSLMDLFEFFLELAGEQKHIYLLAGNHDWLGSHFVYAEANTIFSLEEHNYLHIITQPKTITINNQNILFMPYMLSRDRYTPTQETNSLDVQALKDSSNKDEHDSYLLNSYLEDMIAQHDNLMVVHHYYLANTSFPSIKAKFSYKHKAISPHFLDYDNITLVSGHIHHPFSYKNYLCLGSVRSTSPLETNTLHYLSHYDTHTSKRTLTQTEVNPYLVLSDPASVVDQAMLEEFWNNLQHKEQEKTFVSPQFDIDLEPCKLDLHRTQLTVQSQDSNYEDIDEHVDVELRQSLRDTKLKAHNLKLDEVTKDLIDSSDDFKGSLGSWRELLDKYLSKKFGERKDRYIKALKELDITL